MIKDCYIKKGQKYTVKLTGQERQLISRCLCSIDKNSPNFFDNYLEFFESIDYLDIDQVYNLLFKMRMLTDEEKERLRVLMLNEKERLKQYQKSEKFQEYCKNRYKNLTFEQRERMRERDRERYRKKMAKLGKTVKPQSKYRKEVGK